MYGEQLKNNVFAQRSGIHPFLSETKHHPSETTEVYLACIYLFSFSVLFFLVLHLSLWCSMALVVASTRWQRQIAGWQQPRQLYTMSAANLDWKICAR